jgi:uncharacterized protein YcbX
MPRLARLSVTPVKALALLHPERASITQAGIPENRRFYLVNEDGRLVGIKQFPNLVKVRPTYDAATEWLELRFPDGSTAAGDGADVDGSIETDFWGRPVAAHIVHGPFAAAVSRYVGTPLRLARCDRPGDGPDMHHLSLVSFESVTELARRGGEDRDIDARRFRINLELDGCEPHEEDSWDGRRVRLGDAIVRVEGRIPRCMITTLNPETGTKDFDTLKVIPTYRPLIADDGDGKRGIPFGMYAEVEQPGVVQVGDAVDVLS